MKQNPRLRGREDFFISSCLCFLMVALPALAQQTGPSVRTLQATEPAFLDIAIPGGIVNIVPARADRIVVSAENRGQSLGGNTLESLVSVEQNGNYVRLERALRTGKEAPTNTDIHYRIEVPQRTQVTANIERGSLAIIGVDGPVRANIGAGNIDISFVVKDVSAQSNIGNISISDTSGVVRTVTNRGNIACSRILTKVIAEATDGDITLLVVGPAEAKVQSGPGIIEIGGARGTLAASTAEGDLHVKAVPHQDWQLSSTSGNIRIELPPKATFEIDAATKSGRVIVRRTDMGDTAQIGKELVQKVNGGGQKIQIRTDRGNVRID